MKITPLIIATLAFAGSAFAAGGKDTSAQTTTRASASTTTARPTMTARANQSTTVRSPAHATGQPGAECGSATAPNTPGNAANAPGSAFNENGVAGSKYAGTQPQNSRNTASVSQYDAACLHQK